MEKEVFDIVEKGQIELTSDNIKKQRDGFVGAKQIDLPGSALVKQINLINITNIGYYPNAEFHYRIREKGCKDYILIYCLNGKGHYKSKRGTFTIKPNQFILIPPNEYHCYQSDLKTPWTIYWLHFTSKNVEGLNKDLNLKRFFTPTNLPYNEQIVELWQEMFSSIQEGFSLENLNYANLCLCRFITFFLFPEKINKKVKKSIELDHLDQSIAFMHENIDKRLSAEEIAHEFNFSPSHYSVLFKRKTGQSPIDYFIRIKIRYACELLTQSNLIIKEVGQRIGYDDPYYFSRIFKKVMSCSPMEYKTLHDRPATCSNSSN